jgi:hypothetical protein
MSTKSKVHVKQYRPAFFEGFTDEEADIESASELLSLGFIEHWIKDPNFDRFCISHPYSDYPTYHNLIAECKNGEHWVVARLTGEPTHSLFKYFPKWTPK